MPIPYRIRPATLADSEALAHIQVDSYRTAYANFFPPDYLAQFSYAEQTQDWRDLLTKAATDPKADVLLVAAAPPGEVVAYGLGRLGANLPDYASEIVALHVRQTHQRHGVGRQLVAALAQQLRERQAASLLLWVLEQNPARAFYEKLGGQLIGQQTIDTGEGWFIHEVAYGWPDIADIIRAAGGVSQNADSR